MSAGLSKVSCILSNINYIYTVDANVWPLSLLFKNPVSARLVNYFILLF